MICEADVPHGRPESADRSKRDQETVPNRLITVACLIDVERSRIRDRLMARLDAVGINEYYGWVLKDFGTPREILDPL